MSSKRIEGWPYTITCHGTVQHIHSKRILKHKKYGREQWTIH